MSLYPYSRGDRLNDRNSYSYSAFHGTAFLAAWRADRNDALSSLPAPARPPLPAAALPSPETGYDSAELLTALVDPREELEPVRDRLLQRFEVSKRIYRRYDGALKAIRDSGYDDLGLYLLFGTVCVESEQRPAALRYLNGLLKVLDSLIAARAQLTPAQGAWLAWLIEREGQWVQCVAARSALEWPP